MNWKEENNCLVKIFELNSFSEIVKRLALISAVADEMNHHPDFSVYDYRFIRFELNTHDAGGITDLDYKLAEEIDRILES